MPTIWNITERTEGNATILHASVRGLSIERPPDDHRLLASINDHVRDGYNTILINLRDAHYMDSEGLGEIIRGFTLAHGAGGSLAICELTPKVRDLFSITGLDAQVPIFQTEREGLQALRQGAPISPS
jgi:anti-anti-sigma factor